MGNLRLSAMACQHDAQRPAQALSWHPIALQVSSEMAELLARLNGPDWWEAAVEILPVNLLQVIPIPTAESDDAAKANYKIALAVSGLNAYATPLTSTKHRAMPIMLVLKEAYLRWVAKGGTALAGRFATAAALIRTVEEERGLEVTKGEIATIQAKIINGGSSIRVVHDVMMQQTFKGRGHRRGAGMGAIPEEGGEPEDVQPRKTRRT